jgi:hypothetical protein
VRWIAVVVVALVVGATGSAQADDSGRVVGTVRASPLAVEVTRPDEPLRRGRWFRVVARVSNSGPTRLEDVTVRLVRPPQLMLADPAMQVIPRIPARESRRVDWEVCSNTPGSYVVLARAQDGPFTAESPGAVVQILPSNRTC